MDTQLCVTVKVCEREWRICTCGSPAACVSACTCVCVYVLCRICSTDQMAAEWLRNQYLRRKHTNNASACVCCTSVIKYWHSGFCKNYRLWSKIGIGFAAYRPESALWKWWWRLHICVKCGCRQAVCLSWNTATNSRCQNVLLAVAVTSVWMSRNEREQRIDGERGAILKCSSSAQFQNSLKTNNQFNQAH